MERDGFERFERLRIREPERLARHGGALLERRKKIA